MNTGHQATLAELSRSALAGTDRPRLLRQAVALVAQALMVEYSAFWGADPGTGTLVFQAGTGWLETMAEQYATLPAALLSDGTMPVVVNWMREPPSSPPPAVRELGIRTSLYAVILGPGRVAGLLSADSVALRTFSVEETAFFHAVAQVLGPALAWVQADQTLEQQVEARTRVIEQQLVAAAQETAVLEERQRLARDLHDSVTQALYGITLHAEAASRLLGAGDVTTASAYLHDLQDSAQEALEEMRLLIFELRPPVLEQVGLVAALQARLGTVEGRANLETCLSAEGISSLPAAVEQGLYRVTQEALNNTLKHAHARRVAVTLRHIDSVVTLEISDDGVGFDPAAVGERGGLGLRGMAERVAQLEGRLTVQSTPGGGTRLRVEIAL